MKKRIRKSNAGFSIMETLIASVIMSIIFGSVLSILHYFMHEEQRTVIRTKQERQIMSMIDTIRSQAGSFQANFGAVQTLDLNNLPIAWDEMSWGPVANNPALPGRAGFTIQPLPNNNHLYLVNLLVSHPQLAQTQRSYSFIVQAGE